MKNKSPETVSEKEIFSSSEDWEKAFQKFGVLYEKMLSYKGRSGIMQDIETLLSSCYSREESHWLERVKLINTYGELEIALQNQERAYQERSKIM